MKHAFRRSVLLGLAAALMAAPAPAVADFGTYTQYACRTPDGSPAPADGFGQSFGSVSDTCSQGGSFDIAMESHPGDTPYGAGVHRFYVPPDQTSIVGLSMRRSATGLSGDSQMYYAVQGTNDICDPAHDCSTPGDFSWSGSMDSLAFGLDCSGPNGCQSTSGTTEARVSITRIAVTLRDEALPEFASTPAGALLSSPVRGNQSLTFTAQDAGGGVFQAALVVDGVEQSRQIVDDNDGHCRLPFVYVVPCKATATGTLSLDTASLPDGPHTVGVVVYDATGTNSVRYGPVQIEVDNVPDASDGRGSESNQTTGSGAEPATHFEGLGRFAHSSVAASYARATKVRGRLLDSAGRPIANATVVVFTAAAGETDRLLGEARTGADGQFDVLVPKGGSRRVTVRYTSPGGAAASSWGFRLVVPAPLKLSASRRHLTNGKKLMLTAYLSGAHVPAKSAAVAFQVLIGHQWRTFATRSVGPNGVARIGHRFRVTYQRLTYRFRAVVVGRKTFPFANADSRSVSVVVN